MRQIDAIETRLNPHFSTKLCISALVITMILLHLPVYKRISGISHPCCCLISANKVTAQRAHDTYISVSHTSVDPSVRYRIGRNGESQWRTCFRCNWMHGFALKFDVQLDSDKISDDKTTLAKIREFSPGTFHEIMSEYRILLYDFINLFDTCNVIGHGNKMW